METTRNYLISDRDISAIIFDLDQTLVDTKSIEFLRNSRKWKDIYPLIHTLLPYNGINDLLHDLQQNEYKVGLVTSTPRTYCDRILSHFNWNFDATICYHDTIRHKPYPEPYLKILKFLNTPIINAVAIGDDPKDIISANNAGLCSIAALWGCENPDLLKKSNPDYICENVIELRNMFC